MKADMAVTNLNESKRALRRLRGGSPADQAERAWHPTTQGPNNARSCPSHALQQAAAIHLRRAR